MNVFESLNQQGLNEISEQVTMTSLSSATNEFTQELRQETALSNITAADYSEQHPAVNLWTTV